MPVIYLTNGEVLNAEKVRNSNGTLIVTFDPEGRLPELCFPEKMITSVAYFLSKEDEETDTTLGKFPWKRGIVDFDGRLEDVMISENPNSEDRILILSEEEESYAVFSVWKKYVKYYIDIDMNEDGKQE